jgi:acetyl esterase/lipase
MSEVDSKVILMYEKLEQIGLLRPVPKLSHKENRIQEMNALRLFMRPGAEEDLARIEDLSISRTGEYGRIPLRVYYPKRNSQTASMHKAPLIVFIHGGGLSLESS